MTSPPRAHGSKRPAWSSAARSSTPGVCHQSFFADPDGNPLNLHHRYAPKE